MYRDTHRYVGMGQYLAFLYLVTDRDQYIADRTNMLF